MPAHTPEARPPSADFLLVNGRITTGVPGQPAQQATAVRSGRVLGVGSLAQLQPLVGEATAVVDLDGRRVVPGLIDSHIHFVRAGRSWTDEVRWDDADTLAGALALVTRAARSRAPGAWIVVIGGWHAGQFEEGRAPTRAELDEAAPDNPVYVQESYTRAFLNSRAMAACGVTGTGAAPAGGVYEVDAAGEPTGVVTGVPAFNHCLSRALDLDVERATASTRVLVDELAAYGLTGVVDMGGRSRMSVDAYRPLYQLHRRGELNLRVRLFMHVFGGPEDEEREFEDYLTHVRPGFGDDLLRVVGIGEIASAKWYDADGLEQVVLTPQERARFATMTERAVERGWALNIHGVGDPTVSQLLEVWEGLDPALRARARLAISHADFARPETLRRMKALGVGVTVQHWMTVGAGDLARVIGEEAVRQAPPLRTMLDLGLTVGAGTDAMVAASANPWYALHWLVTGINRGRGPSRDKAHLLTREEALRAYTAGSAWFGGDERACGTLEPGKLADLAVLDADFFEVSDDQIPHIRSELTLVGGKPSHIGPAFAGLMLPDPS
ncbi:amidohydrolase [Phytohabitans sp. ZYX-F-186]|uniref:Amidohydrolase n=1 Tax=Phytohabitans maris TaxID=3071409 RepID=A0ABU0ZVS2_9ACTN|nr:amidohydrolase [Phytohabitans sp. ZYX-F-186]MDQ7911128.1 amidohydrolase [Phytohabitans sp. ZYX-F-186]